MRKILIAVWLILLIGNFGFASEIRGAAATAQSVEKAEKFVRTELYFGMTKPNDGGEISEAEFAAFLEEIVTPAFPEGLTVLFGYGQFRNASGKLVKENAKVLILLYPSAARKAADKKIEEIRAAYKKRFQQQSVLRVDETVRAAF